MLINLGHVGILINLFNLIPVGFLDGGTSRRVRRPFWIVGYVVGAAAVLVTKSPLLLIVLVVGLFTLFQRWNHPVPGYDDIPPEKRWLIGLSYAVLVAALCPHAPDRDGAASRPRDVIRAALAFARHACVALPALRSRRSPPATSRSRTSPSRPQLGSGIYTIDGRTVQIYRIPIQYVIKKETDEHWGPQGHVPAHDRVLRLQAVDVVDTGVPDSLDTLSLVPGLEFRVPVGNVLLKPFLEAAWPRRRVRYERVGLLRGLRIFTAFKSGKFDVDLGNAFVYARVDPEGEVDIDDFSLYSIAAQARHTMGVGLWNHELEYGLYTSIELYNDVPNFPLPADGHLSINDQYEIGATIGPRRALEDLEDQAPQGRDGLPVRQRRQRGPLRDRRPGAGAEAVVSRRGSRPGLHRRRSRPVRQGRAAAAPALCSAPSSWRLLAWLPLLILSLVSQRTRVRTRVSFFHDIAVHVRFLLVIRSSSSRKRRSVSARGRVVRTFLTSASCAPTTAAAYRRSSRQPSAASSPRSSMGSHGRARGCGVSLMVAPHPDRRRPLWFEQGAPGDEHLSPRVVVHHVTPVLASSSCVGVALPDLVLVPEEGAKLDLHLVATHADPRGGPRVRHARARTPSRDSAGGELRDRRGDRHRHPPGGCFPDELQERAHRVHRACRCSRLLAVRDLPRTSQTDETRRAGRSTASSPRATRRPSREVDARRRRIIGAARLG
jgi:hypothetical protein